MNSPLLVLAGPALAFSASAAGSTQTFSQPVTALPFNGSFRLNLFAPSQGVLSSVFQSLEGDGCTTILVTTPSLVPTRLR